MQHGPDYRYVFVCGLHRSGTSLVARMIADLPGVGAITGAAVPENEGAYLQGAIPHHALSGIPMHFATDPQQHMTEGHPLDRLETRQRLENDWGPWYPSSCRWRVEKSPVNLTRMRLLQQLFPMAHFVIVLRHPEAVAAAVAKWVDTPAPALIDHWLDAHDRVGQDLSYLHAASVVRYEDLVRNPARIRAGLAAFLDIALTDPSGEVIRDGNKDYPNAPEISPSQVIRATVWGYGPQCRVDATWPPLVRHPLREIREGVEKVFKVLE
jgi:hypothetical protein